MTQNNDWSSWIFTAAFGFLNLCLLLTLANGTKGVRKRNRGRGREAGPFIFRRREASEIEACCYSGGTVNFGVFIWPLFHHCSLCNLQRRTQTGRGKCHCSEVALWKLLLECFAHNPNPKGCRHILLLPITVILTTVFINLLWAKMRISLSRSLSLCTNMWTSSNPGPKLTT